MTLVGSIRARVQAPEIRRRIEEYAGPFDDAARAAFQLEALEREWSRIAGDVPHYADEIRGGRLPEHFASLEEFVASVPPTTRADVQDSIARRSSRSRRAEFARITGGSTAQPVQLPAWRSELAFTLLDAWMGRSWYGLGPASRVFLLWGHSHLLGTGLPGWLRARKREVLDRALGYLRFSAYDLRPERMQAAGRALERFRPDYVVGYGVALDALAHANAGRSFRDLGVRLVLGAAEAFPAPDTTERLEEMFGCPTGMEYGSVETNLIAHTHPEGGYRVFWRSYLVEAEATEAGRSRVRVTSLYPRCFPLVRYDMGDELELGGAPVAQAIGLTRIERVIGRCNDYVELPDGTRVHSEAFTHSVRPASEVKGYQVVQTGSSVRIDLLAGDPLSSEAEHAIRERLRKIHPALAGIAIQRVEELRRTVAGKTPMVVRTP